MVAAPCDAFKVGHKYKGTSTFVPRLGVSLSLLKASFGRGGDAFSLVPSSAGESFVYLRFLSHIPYSRITMTANELYTAFSFIGFVMCAIPLYWHLEGTEEFALLGSPHTEIAWHSLEYRHLLVHVLDWSWMPDTMHQLDRMEQKYGQQGSDLV